MDRALEKADEEAYLKELATDLIREGAMYTELLDVVDRWDTLDEIEAEKVLEYVHTAQIEVTW